MPPFAPNRRAARVGPLLAVPGVTFGPGAAAAAPAIAGLVPVRVPGDDRAGAAFRLVAPEDGYYDEGPQGYAWRLRPGR